jgi:hypothetical protein
MMVIENGRSLKLRPKWPPASCLYQHQPRTKHIQATYQGAAWRGGSGKRGDGRGYKREGEAGGLPGQQVSKTTPHHYNRPLTPIPQILGHCSRGSLPPPAILLYRCFARHARTEPFCGSVLGFWPNPAPWPRVS